MGLLQQAGQIANRFNGGANAGGGQGKREALPAPIDGWNTRDPINNMGPEFALQLDNLFPNHGRVSCRRGFRKHVDVDGVSDAFKSLHSFRADSVRRLWGFAGSTMYDCTPQVDDPLITAPAEVIAGLAGRQMERRQFRTECCAVLGRGRPDTPRLDGRTGSSRTRGAVRAQLSTTSRSAPCSRTASTSSNATARSSIICPCRAWAATSRRWTSRS